MLFNDLAVEILRALTRLVSGKLLTNEQISGVTGNVVGKYFADWFPISQEEATSKERVDRARDHISQATRIIAGLQDDLEVQASQLDTLAREIEEKKTLAERYAMLAKTNQETFAAFKAEMEQALRQELVTQANAGKRLRQVASFVVWLVTLVLGAALGAYLPKIVTLVRGAA